MVRYAACKPKWLKTRVGVLDDIPEFVIVDSLVYGTVGGVDDQSWAAEVVGDNTVGHTALDQIVGDIDLTAIDEPRYNAARAIELGNGVQLILIQKALSEGAVDGLTDPSILRIDEVFNSPPVGQGNLGEVSEDVIGVARGLPGLGFGEKLAVDGVGMGCPTVA